MYTGEIGEKEYEAGLEKEPEPKEPLNPYEEGAGLLIQDMSCALAAWLTKREDEQIKLIRDCHEPDTTQQSRDVDQQIRGVTMFLLYLQEYCHENNVWQVDDVFGDMILDIPALREICKERGIK